MVVLKEVFKPSVILWFNLCFAGRRGFKFIVLLNAFVNVRCTEVGSIFSIKVHRTWPLRKVEQKYMERFELWSWTMMEISCADLVRHELLLRAKDERNILHTVKRKKG